MSRVHIKLDRPRSSTLFLFESHENMERVCRASRRRREHGSPPFYSRVNVYEFVNKQPDTARILCNLGVKKLATKVYRNRGP